MDPSTESGNTLWTCNWESNSPNVASFIDEYKSSTLLGSASALGDDNFLLTDDPTGFDKSGLNPLTELDNHGYAYVWYTQTIMDEVYPNPLGLGWGWNVGSWSKAKAALESTGLMLSDQPGEWKGIIYGPTEELEAFPSRQRVLNTTHLTVCGTTQGLGAAA